PEPSPRTDSPPAGSARLLLFGAIVVFAASTGMAVWQRFSFDPQAPAVPWRSPIVLNREALLPRIQGTFNDVHSPDGPKVVAVGDAGLMTVSGDGGVHWSLDPVIVPVTVAPPKPAEPPKPPTRTQPTTFGELWVTAGQAIVVDLPHDIQRIAT